MVRMGPNLIHLWAAILAVRGNRRMNNSHMSSPRLCHDRGQKFGARAPGRELIVLIRAVSEHVGKVLRNTEQPLKEAKSLLCIISFTNDHWESVCFNKS